MPSANTRGGRIRARGGGIIKPAFLSLPPPRSRTLRLSPRLTEHNPEEIPMAKKKPMAPRPPPNARPTNHLLRALPEAEFQRLRPDLKTIPTSAKQLFHKHGEPIEFVYFPNGGVASITAVLSDGTMVETATVGREGMVGIEAFFGKNAVAPGETMMQVPDMDAEQLSVVAFRREVARQGIFADVIGRYAQASVAQMMQSTACNARHHIQERCARWLLTTHDRVERDDFELSHEFLAIMLGVRRQSVTVVAGTLQRAGLLTYKHGRITVLDRTGLEAASCECYASVRSRFDALLK
jgi:CRP-like cAMP-binding protein